MQFVKIISFKLKYLILLNKLILLINVQLRATKLAKELKNLSYEERLVKLNVTALQERRLREDLIQIYIIIIIIK